MEICGQSRRGESFALADRLGAVRVLRADGIFFCVNMRNALVLLLGFLVCAHGVPKDALLQGRIVTGEEASDGQFPFLVSIRIKSVHYCAGTIIDAEWILTAAHCKYSDNLDDYTVITGTNHLNSGGTEHKISKFTTHEDHYAPNIENDIALIKLSSPIQFTDIVKPAKLPEYDIAYTEILTASGWGYTSSPATTPNQLMWISVRILSQFKCEIKFETIKSGHICTYTKQGAGICSGDSGGPLTAHGIIYAIGTWSRPCSIDGHPDIFTRVHYYLAWIKDVMREG